MTRAERKIMNRLAIDQRWLCLADRSLWRVKQVHRKDEQVELRTSVACRPFTIVVGCYELATGGWARVDVSEAVAT